MSNFDDLDFDALAQELDNGAQIVEVTSGLGRIRDYVPPTSYMDTIQAEFMRQQEAVRRAGAAGAKDEFYQHVELQNLKAKEASREAQQVGNPESSVRNILGRNMSLSPSTQEVRVPLCRWQGEDSVTMPVTVTIGLETPIAVQAVANSKLRPFAIVRWGTSGGRFVAGVDVGTGRQFTVNASMVEVEAALEGLATLPGTIPTVNFAGALSFHQMMRTAPLQRTRYIDNALQNVAQSVTVPDFATEVMPLQMTDVTTPGSVQLDFIDSSNAIVYSIIITLGSQVFPIPLSGDVQQINVTSLGATTQTVRLVFGLSI